MTSIDERASADESALRAWRKQQREVLIARRLALDGATIVAARLAIESLLEATFPDLARGIVAFCWPIRNEFDARHLVARLRTRGAVSALPVVAGPRLPLIFRAWRPGEALEVGPLDIPYPATGDPLTPDTAILPMNGFDRAGYRLGYGAGFFDRTLAAQPSRPRTIGVAYAFAELPTIHPQPYDIPMDFVVTEEASYRRTEAGLVAIHRNKR